MLINIYIYYLNVNYKSICILSYIELFKNVYSKNIKYNIKIAEN